MSFAALAGGAECGPVNPLSQLSKVYGQDRGVQQDHFNPQAGSPSSVGLTFTSTGMETAFRRSGPSSSSSQPLADETSHFFQQQQNQRGGPHAFDLSPLNRALTPQNSTQAPGSVNAAAAPPPWAQAFSQQMRLPSPASNQSAIESEAFRRAFQPQAPNMVGGAGGGAAQLDWTNDFRQHRASPLASQQQGPNPAMSIEAQQSGRMAYSTGQQRLFGAGFGAPALAMSRPTMYQPSMQQNDVQHGSAQRDLAVSTQVGIRRSTGWEDAFKAQEAEATTDTSKLVHESYQPISEYEQRSSSPVLSQDQARDALAETAGRLLDTVRSSEQTRHSNQEVDKADDAAAAAAARNAKFANSTFLDLMRKLRDGEVAVEGDKVVEQIEPKYSSAEKGKGRATDSSSASWANQFGREEEGRIGGAAPTTGAFGLSSDGVGARPSAAAEFAQANQQFSERQARNAQLSRELEQGYQTMAGLWDDEDQVRLGREQAAADRARWQFQGDGGGIAAEDEQMGEEATMERTREKMRMDTSVPLASSNWEEEVNDPSMIVGGHAMKTARAPQELSAQQREWDMLQQDWDAFDVSAAGLKPVASTSSSFGGYTFHQNNPYMNLTRHHSLHGAYGSSNYDTILQKEAAVQQRPHDPQAWLALGIKQQENEREEMAIQALRQALSIDPELGEAHLALAVSYTNENDRPLAYEAVDKWVNTLGQTRYKREVDAFRDLFGTLPEQQHIRHEYLTNLLIRLAQSRESDDVDAEVQIGLGVLFNASEEYEKASDCFESALSVRPNDPLLFNRLGATFANSGKTDLAIQYYVEALEIQPNYVRARFNLAVANMNLHVSLGNRVDELCEGPSELIMDWFIRTQQYEEAVHHLLTSLSIQEADALLEAGDVALPSNGVTSQTLWDSLNIALLQMNRSDLATMTASRDLAGLTSALNM
ncbi:BQ2448_1240 [Microbotryum intermedium]|uniref:BQ2448_1240 protein n=1 Tax=Microbotryum intermedium TaxID=269621 RepID=A0A238FFH7_9BASI|nr:BQ2448_1240 [Microbotryum intermedium]